MGIFSKISKGISSKANAALDKAIDPEKEVDMMILELENQRKKALEELIAYKATAKQMDQDIARQEEKATHWEQQAMKAVKAGDDELAKQALAEKKRAQVEKARIVKDRDEALGYAIELNRSRKAFETRLQILKLKKSTLATQLAAARSGSANPFGHDDEVWDRLERAAEDILDGHVGAPAGPDPALQILEHQPQELLVRLPLKRPSFGARWEDRPAALGAVNVNPQRDGRRVSHARRV